MPRLWLLCLQLTSQWPPRPRLSSPAGAGGGAACGRWRCLGRRSRALRPPGDDDACLCALATGIQTTTNYAAPGTLKAMKCYNESLSLVFAQMAVRCPVVTPMAPAAPHMEVLETVRACVGDFINACFLPTSISRLESCREVWPSASLLRRLKALQDWAWHFEL